MADTTQSPVIQAVPGTGNDAQPDNVGVHVPQDTALDEIDRPSALDVAGAEWRVNTLLGQGFRELTHADISEAKDPSFNPYTFLKANEKEYGDILPYIMNDTAVSSIQSEAGLRRYIEGQRLNLKDKQTIAQGDLWGHTLGMGLSMMDVTSLLSVGGLALDGVEAATTLGRAAKTAAIFGTDAAAQQGVLLSTDSTLTPEEAFMNIGVGTALGAGLGPLFRHVKPDSPLLPDSAVNPLRPENVDKPLPVHEHFMGETPEEGFTIHPDPDGRLEPVFGADSIGAARAAEGSGQAYEDATELARGGVVNRAVDWGTSFLKATPAQRLFSYTIPEMREAGLRMMDVGGLMTKANAEGIAHAPSAEDLKLLSEQRMNHALRGYDSDWVEANKTLGQSAAGTAARDAATTATLGAIDKNSVTRDGFNKAVMAIMAGSNSKATNEQIADSVRRALSDAGLSPDQVEQVRPHVYAAEKRLHDAMEAQFDYGLRSGMIDPESKGDGRYGAPQVYDRHQVTRDMEHFKALLRETLGSTPYESWLREEGFIRDPHRTYPEGVEAPAHGSWDDIKNSGDHTLVNDILKSWRGEENDFRNGLLQAQLDAASARVERAQQDAVDILGTYRMAKRGWQHAKLDEMKAEGRSLERNAVLRSMASAQLRASRAAEAVQSALDRLGGDESAYGDILTTLQNGGMQLDEAGAAVDAARQRVAKTSEAQDLVDELRGKVEQGKQDLAGIKGEKRDVLSDLKDVTENLGGTEQARAKTPLFQQRDALNTQRKATLQEVNEAKVAIRDALAERRVALDDLRAANQEFDRVAKEQAVTREWHDAAAKEINRIKANEADALLEPGLRHEMEGQLDAAQVLKQRLAEATEARRDWADLHAQARRTMGLANVEEDRSLAELKRARREARKGIVDQHPLEKVVEDMAGAFAGIEKAPRGLLLDDIAESGRVKERRIDYSPEMYQKMMDAGFLKSNPADLFQSFSKDLGGRQALHDAFGGRAFNDVVRDIAENYDRKIGSAQGKARERLQAEKTTALKDLDGLRNRIMGVYEAQGDDPITWTADRMRDLGILRYGGGFVISAINDLATAAFAAPGSALRSIAFKGTREFSALAKAAIEGKEGAQELEMLMGSLEHGLAANMSERSLGTGAGRDYVGFGTGTTRKITGAIETWMKQAGSAVAHMSLLAGWSDNIRRTAGLVQLSKIRQWSVKGFDTLSKGQQAQLTALGIGRAEANRLATLFDKYGEDWRHNLFIPNMGKWAKERDGEQMRQVLEAALLKTQKRASLTGGYGHTPLCMDKSIGKLFLQFQTMAFAFQNNFVRAGVQYGAVTGDHIRFASALGWALATGVAINTIKSLQKGEDPTKQFEQPQQFAYNILQRSGLTGSYGSYLDAGVKLLDPALKNNLGFTLGGGASKFSQNSWAENLLGPWLGNVQTVQQTVSGAVSGDYTQAGEKALRLIPMNQMFLIGRQLYNASQ
jgi:hypothetical protein